MVVLAELEHQIDALQPRPHRYLQQQQQQRRDAVMHPKGGRLARQMQKNCEHGELRRKQGSNFGAPRARAKDINHAGSEGAKPPGRTSRRRTRLGWRIRRRIWISRNAVSGMPAPG